jgi:hypothetical protein
MKRLIVVFAFALAFVSTLTASAQTFKWSFTAFATDWATDGRGSLAVVHRTEAPVQLGAVTWVDPAGRPLFTNVIADLGENIASFSVRVVRFHGTELAVQVEANYEHAPGTNFLRRFKSDGAFKDTVLTVGETMDAKPSTLIDDRGFFTRTAEPVQFTFRRYSN